MLNSSVLTSRMPISRSKSKTLHFYVHFHIKIHLIIISTFEGMVVVLFWVSNNRNLFLQLCDKWEFVIRTEKHPLNTLAKCTWHCGWAEPKSEEQGVWQSAPPTNINLKNFASPILLQYKIFLLVTLSPFKYIFFLDT